MHSSSAEEARFGCSPMAWCTVRCASPSTQSQARSSTWATSCSLHFSISSLQVSFPSPRHRFYSVLFFYHFNHPLLLTATPSMLRRRFRETGFSECHEPARVASPLCRLPRLLIGTPSLRRHDRVPRDVLGRPAAIWGHPRGLKLYAALVVAKEHTAKHPREDLVHMCSEGLMAVV